MQGDIVAVYNSNGTKIGTYAYDAWGNFTITSSATGLERQIVYEINPFRYRGYYYDVETGWYYLQSRYYNPEWGRFLNADGYISTGTGFIGYNMYAYCNNNPIAFLDSSGNEPISVTIAGLATAALVAILAVGAVYVAVEFFTAAVEVGYEAYVELSEGISEVTSAISEKIDQLNEDHPGEYYVYVLKHPTTDSYYIGRTKNLEKRLLQHEKSKKNRGYKLEYYYEGLTWAEARGLEEYEMFVKNSMYVGNNSIHGISPNNPNLIPYTFAAKNYLINKLENIFYDLLE